MKKLKSHQIGCFNCDGHCCTKQSNSMKITPLEAFELMIFLQDQNLDLLKDKLRANVSEFRLEHEVYTGKNTITHFEKLIRVHFTPLAAKGAQFAWKINPTDA